jgi:hypothetical protein
VSTSSPEIPNPEFVGEWDVYRDLDGNPVRLTVEQVRAIWHAINVVESVRSAENFESLWSHPYPNLAKSRLLGRMLVDGRPPTRTKPPRSWGGPDWSALPGGDPFGEAAEETSEK